MRFPKASVVFATLVTLSGCAQRTPPAPTVDPCLLMRGHGPDGEIQWRIADTPQTRRQNRELEARRMLEGCSEGVDDR